MQNRPSPPRRAVSDIGERSLRSRGALVATTLVLTVSAFALPTAAGAAVPDGDFVRGQLSSHFYPWFYINVDASSGPSGENPSGTFEADQAVRRGLIFSGTTVTCLAVSGNRAVVGGHGTLSHGGWGYEPNYPVPPSETRGFLLAVEDNGEGSVDENGYYQTADKVSYDYFLPEAPRACNAPADRPLIAWPENGDIVVHDAKPIPTTKDQCKNNGWRNYADRFKNQGQCVSSVATGGKQKS